MLPADNAAWRLTEVDLDFVVGEAAPHALDKERLKELIPQDEDFRKALVGDDKVFQRVMSDEEIFIKISPSLYFEILLRRALKELEAATHTVERAGKQSIPVFDSVQVVELLNRPEVLKYLAHLLASFTRIQSYVVPVRVQRGIRRRVRYNDMDIDSLIRFCAAADENHRLGFYKRIADVCLFVSGVFPDQTLSGYAHPAAGASRSSPSRKPRRSLEDYEVDGRRFYGFAEEHPTSRMLDLSHIFGLLRQHFVSARKPLSFIATQYLHSHQHQLFGVQSQ